jgi:hypothetical protein
LRIQIHGKLSGKYFWRDAKEHAILQINTADRKTLIRLLAAVSGSYELSELAPRDEKVVREADASSSPVVYFIVTKAS